MRRIAFLLQTLTGGGAERTVANLSFPLSDKFEVYIILFDGSKVSYPHKGTIIDLKAPSRKTSIGKVFNILRRTVKLRKIKKEYNFDVTVSFMFSANIINVMSRYNDKIITSIRNYMSGYGMTKGLKKQERFTGLRSDKIIAISEIVRQDLIHNFDLPQEIIETIYNPCDVERINRIADEEVDFEFDNELFYFVTAGRLVHQKGQWDLIKAFSLVSKERDNARLIILGDGTLKERLQKLTEDAMISDKVFFMGFQDNPYAYMKKSNAFVLTSLHEGLGNVVLEALACGLPIISTDCYAGPREILAPDSNLLEKTEKECECKYGVLVPQISNKEDFSLNLTLEHEELAKAMLKILDSQDLRQKYAQRSSERIKDFDPRVIAGQWEKTLLEIGNNNE